MGPEGHVTDYEYDSQANLTLIRVHAAGGVTYEYHLGYDDPDAPGRPTSFVDPAGRTTRYTYDLQGNVATVTNAEEETTSFSRDAAGNVVRIRSHEGRVVCMGYDPMGRLATIRVQRGQPARGPDRGPAAPEPHHHVYVR
jgi:YD repeat-containing protein